MGQKVHPFGVRLGFFKDWRARWYAKKDFKQLLHEDLQIRKKVKDALKHSGVSHIDIERSSGRVRIKIYSARPGIVIGRKGAEIDKLRSEVQKISNKEIFIDIKEVKNPLINGQLVAENVAQQLEKRVSFRKAMKKAIQSAMTKGAAGIKIQCSGRLQGAEIARVEKYKEGSIPLSTFRANIEYGFATAQTTYGSIGVKVWIYIDKKELTEVEAAGDDANAEAGKDKHGRNDNRKDSHRGKSSADKAANEGDVSNVVNAIES